ncbi:Hypothetical_protein [Hexamita inflata]|uniref:Hypothetical_protein n=1 Tax=Hexamita inflata TaxID=28002 RepID=A0ABP1HS38_9EUKA
MINEVPQGSLENQNKIKRKETVILQVIQQNKVYYFLNLYYNVVQKTIPIASEVLFNNITFQLQPFFAKFYAQRQEIAVHFSVNLSSTCQIYHYAFIVRQHISMIKSIKCSYLDSSLSGNTNNGICFQNARGSLQLNTLHQ